MLSFLKRLLEPAKDAGPAVVPDPVLGELRLNGEGEWEGRIDFDGKRVVFYLGGEERPDGSLVEHAQALAQSFGEFERRVGAFLAEEARGRGHLRPFADEIGRLEIESVSLWRTPGDGMIYFKGPDEFRVWRCDYIAGEPKDLGFDD